MMKEKLGTRFKHFLVFQLPIVFSLLVSVQAQNQTGFISLDCGRLPRNASYSEPSTGITYVSDEPYIEGGESKSIQPEYSAVLQEQAVFVRSFPDGTRNCYRIGVAKDTRYLIRATFLYGNYDGLNELPQFELHFGISLWDTVTILGDVSNVIKDVVHVVTQDVVRICLVNTGSGTPFISALEFRPLKNTSYVTPSGSLSLYLRGDVGSTLNGSVYRYPFDVHDRLWFPYYFSGWTQLATNETINTSNNFQPASIVLRTAGTPIDETSPMIFGWTDRNPATMYYVYLHFAELQDLKANESRAFNVMFNGEHLYGPIVPDKLAVFTMFTPSGLNGGSFNFSIVRLDNSTLPPILNGIEIYTWVDFSRPETDLNDVDAITMIKSTYGVKKNWGGDPCLPSDYAWTGLNCSFDGFEPPRITSLNLSSSGLTGEISSYISNLTLIESLDLSNNNLTGPVPSFLSQLTKLKLLNLERNKLTGTVPAELLQKSESGVLLLSVGENADLCSSVSCGVTEKKPKKSSVVVPIVASVCGSIVLMLIMATIVFSVRKRKKRLAQSREADLVGYKKRHFKHSEIVKMTNNFEKTLGKGGFGTVYLGTIAENNTQVAVKMLSLPKAARGNRHAETENQDSMVDFYNQQFQAEVKLLMRVHHGNLTSLIGYCDEGDNKALIYELMSKGDLSSHILGGSDTDCLSWETRLQIVIDSAQGLEYLHTGCKPPIVHRDVKTTNILLNDRFQAKIADFGLSKVFPTDGDATHVSTRVAGTRGYLDPEYYQTGWLNEKSDVYSFGVVILEIITGRRALIRTPEETTVVQWVTSMLSSGDIKSVVEPRLRGDFDTNSAWKAVESAMACVSWTPNRRPTMSQVVTEFKECLAAELARKNNNNICVAESTMDSVDDNPAANVSSLSEISPIAR